MGEPLSMLEIVVAVVLGLAPATIVVLFVFPPTPPKDRK